MFELAQYLGSSWPQGFFKQVPNKRAPVQLYGEELQELTPSLYLSQVKTNKIAEDSKQLKQQTIDVNKRLRAERVRLMAVKVKEQTGEDITLDGD